MNGRHTDGGIVPTYYERPSPVVGKLSKLLYVDGRMIAEQEPDGSIKFFEDVRRDELNAEIDWLRTQVTALTTELEGTRAFAKAQTRTVTKLEDAIADLPEETRHHAFKNLNLPVFAGTDRAHGVELSPGSGH